MRNPYQERKEPFVAKARVQGINNNKPFKRVFDEGYTKDGHTIGINEIYTESKKRFDTTIKYQVTDSKDPKATRIFDFGDKKGARMYAKELKERYEND